MARHASDRLFIGIDANAAGLQELSGRAFRARQQNLLFVRAAIENLPPELTGLADQVSVVLPWGSLLAAVARPSVSLIGSIRGLCQPDAQLTVIFGIDPNHDRSEIERLGLARIGCDDFGGQLASGYGDAGFCIDSLRTLHAEELARWPSTWAKRLARGPSRSIWKLALRFAPSLRTDHPAVVFGDDDGGGTGRRRAVGPGREV
jgi:16S rRNA (adenine(1408)-N(1))-methyltransferase